MSGAGSEFPKLFNTLGPLPNNFKPHLWQKKIKKAYPELQSLHKEFYDTLGEKIAKKFREREELRLKYSFCSHISNILKVKYKAIGSQIVSIDEILPIFMEKLLDDNLKDCLVIAGLPKISNLLTYKAPPGSTKLTNTTIKSFASELLLIKEWVENREGKFIYFHTEDYPGELYNPAHNPYLVDLLLLRLYEGDLSSLLGSSNYWSKFDGRHYDAGAHKIIGHKLAELVGKLT